MVFFITPCKTIATEFLAAKRLKNDILSAGTTKKDKGNPEETITTMEV
jgi:hypothetical protein